MGNVTDIKSWKDSKVSDLPEGFSWAEMEIDSRFDQYLTPLYRQIIDSKFGGKLKLLDVDAQGLYSIIDELENTPDDRHTATKCTICSTMGILLATNEQPGPMKSEHFLPFSLTIRLAKLHMSQEDR